jgi:hypothetical protein
MKKFKSAQKEVPVEKPVEKSKTPKVKNGEKKYYYNTGELKSIVNYKNNKKVGVSHTFYPSGEKQYDIPYVDGMKHGKVIWYYKSGKVYRETDYVKGKKTGMQRKYWENGQLKSEMPFKNSLPGKGLREIGNTGKEKKVAYIKVEKIDKLASAGKYILKFRLSNGRKKVKFYAGTLSEGKYFSELGKGIMEMKTVSGVGEFVFHIPPGFQVIKDFQVIAVESTSYKNKRIISKKVPISVRNK